MKSVELTQSQIKALENNATMLIFPCEHDIISSDKERTVFKVGEWEHDQPTDLYIKDFAPLQKGDKDLRIQEEFAELSKQLSGDFNELVDKNKRVYDFLDIVYKSDYDEKEIFFDNWTPSSQMTKEQSRYSIDCLDVKLVKVQELSIRCIVKCTAFSPMANSVENQNRAYMLDFIDWYNNQMKEQNINKTYKDNDYVFLAEVKFNKDKK